MIALLAVLACLLCLAAGFLLGFVFAHRRLPDTLARMTPEELRDLAERTAARKRFEIPPTPSYTERVREAEAAVMERRRQEAEARRAQEAARG